MSQCLHDGKNAVLNPYRNIHADLAQTLIAPKVLSERSLSSMRPDALSDWSSVPVKLDPKSIDWTTFASGAKRLRIKSPPMKGPPKGDS